ncbi:MAG: Ribosomal protein, partial [Verrucomicrobiota bacterium]
MSAKSSAILAVGRRKTASARIRLSRGTGVIVVNGKPVEEYLYTEALVKSAT